MIEVKYTGRIDEDGIWLDGLPCPKCGSKDTEGIDNVGSGGEQPQRCNACGIEFMAIPDPHPTTPF